VTKGSAVHFRVPPERASYRHLFIGGQWTEPHSGAHMESVDPSTERVWAEVPRADEVDVEAAVGAARAALAGAWSRMTSSDRGQLLYRLAELVEASAGRLAELETRDNGKPVRDTTAEVGRAAAWLRFYAGAADKYYGETIPVRPDALAYTIREPVGVVAAITPWNSPLYLYSWKLGPALCCGNTVVLKPAAQTSVTALELAKLIESAGFPPGVVNVVTGTGASVGQALARHPGIDKITVTGDHETAQRVMRDAAVNLKRVTFECGGKAPHVIFGDADVGRALTVAVHSAFRSTGQSCTIGSRLFLERGIYDDALRTLSERTRRIRIGAPLDAKTHLGPQASQQQLEKTLRYIDIGRSEGARLVCGGARPPAFEHGYYVEPTIFADVDNDSRLAQDEIFGPVLSVMPFDDEDEVVDLANRTRYGLVGGLWTSDVSRAHRVAARLRMGTVSVNSFRPVHWMLPYGGMKLSGIGRENGLEALREYTEVKSVFIDLAREAAPDPFA
jgi:(Z)-2-((N-methylformamido)methylene)-5-hydroxybutyrolactone dehydrogenase